MNTRPILVAAVGVLAIAVLIILAGLMPHPSAERCNIPGHARTTIVECEAR